MTTEPYTTLDGSLITELIRPETEGSGNLSVARAVIMPGQSTFSHYHGSSEEVYYVLEGQGLLRINARTWEVGPGSVHLIRPGDEHNVTCMGETPLTILCACAPPYRHEDTVVTERVAV